MVLASFPDDPVVARAQEPDEEELLGISVREITPDLERRYNLPDTDGGLLITEVEPRSSAGRKGLQAGDIVLEVNRERVDSVREHSRQVNESDSDKPVLLLIQRGERTFFTALKS